MDLKDLSILASLLLIALSASCSGSSVAGSKRNFELSNGVSVVVDDASVALSDPEGRPLWSSGNGHFTARTFQETWSGPLAIYEFERSNETKLEFDVIVTSKEEDGAAAIVFGTTSNPEAKLTLRVVPGERTTTLTASTEGFEYDSITLPIRCDESGSFHGFGAQYNATNQVGEKFSLLVSEQGIGRMGGAGRFLSGDKHTTYFPMPYYVDARGFGVLIETDHRVEADVCASESDQAYLEVVGNEPLQAKVFHGPTPGDVIEQLGDTVGRPAMPPSWAFSPWISIQGGQSAVIAEADALQDAEIPVAALWAQDWTGLRRNIGGGSGVQYRWEVDPSLYPDLSSMIETLGQRGLRFFGYANPFVDQNLENHFPEMAARSLLVRDAQGAPYVFDAPNGKSSHPDFTNPQAEAYVVEALRQMVEKHGMDGWMADFGEWTPLDAVVADGTDPAAYHNRFVVDWHAANRAAMEAARPNGDWVLFARSGWTGVQAHSMIHWVGDQQTNWSETDGLPTVVPAMINLGLAAVPYVTHDIGGFSGGPRSKEVFLRWTELGAFTPFMRTHEGDHRDENWNWDSDEETVAHFRRFARIHEALVPDLQALAEDAQATSIPLVRHLMLQFPEDSATWNVDDQYMLGDRLLVAPVVTESATSREVYLPSTDAEAKEGGEAPRWFHVFTGESFEGGQTVTVDAPIGTPPVFSLGVDRPELRAIE